MKTRLVNLAIAVAIVAIVPSGCFTDREKPTGISGIPAKTDPGTPGVEYREVVINGVTYSASRSKSAGWQSGGTQERWDLVGPKP